MREGANAKKERNKKIIVSKNLILINKRSAIIKENIIENRSISKKEAQPRKKVCI